MSTSDHCIATHPSDVAVPLTALDAVVRTSGLGGERAIGIDDFFLLPGDTPQREHPLEHGELITANRRPGRRVPRRRPTQPRRGARPAPHLGQDFELEVAQADDGPAYRLGGFKAFPRAAGARPPPALRR
jgi:hypothetical protein